MANESIDETEAAKLKSFLLNDYVSLSLIAVSVFNLIVTLPRFSSGIPNGIDSSGHLFKALYLFMNYETYKKIPAWCSSWYGGVPFLQLYSPLSYYVLFAMGLVGFDIIFAYKVLDAFFYVITPLFVYFLARSLHLSKRVSVIAAALFSITPVTIENFIYYDRFPTTMALPFLCLFLGFFYKFLENGKAKNGVLAVLCGAAVVIIHHLTAYSIGPFAAAMLLVHYLKDRNFKRLLKIAVLTLLGVTLLSAFWLIPFIAASHNLAENPFYNRSNLYDYVNLFNLKTLLDSFNIVQFIFAVIAIGLLMRFARFGEHGTLFEAAVSISIFLIAGGLILHSAEFAVATYFVAGGLGLFALSYIIGLFFEDSPWRKNTGLLLSGLWFIILVWISLGAKAYLFSALPFWDKLDLFRFQNFTAIPEAILASTFIVEAFKEEQIQQFSSYVFSLHRQSFQRITLSQEREVDFLEGKKING